MKKTIFLFFLFSIIIFSCKKEKEYSKTQFLLGTICEVKIVSSYNKDFVDKIFDKVFSEVERINKTFGYSKDSEIYKINSNAGINEVVVSKEVFDLIKASIYIGDLTYGSFDITSGILSSIWKFEDLSNEEIKFKKPSEEEIKKVLDLVGYKKIVLDENKNSVFLPKKGMRINLGGIAKGYAIKKTKEILESYKIERFLINFGGDIYLKNKKNFNPWRIAVQHPRRKNEFLCILELNTTSCFTSGDYERFFMINNQRYHHIFDPKTGYPKEGVVSVTVLCEDPVFADALATGIFVLGKDEGVKLAEKLNIDVIIVVEEDNEIKVFTTEKLKNIKFNI
ncbi:MAG: FAD:protein FMN transferase [Endomicrobiia bacterium]